MANHNEDIAACMNIILTLKVKKIYSVKKLLI